MAEKDVVFKNFWSQFAPAYDETSVPDEKDIIAIHGSAFPRITYDVVLGDTMNENAMSASLWDRSSSWNGVMAVFDQINDTLSNGGVILPCDGGGLWIKKASPWAQRLGDASDDSIRRLLLNISVEFITDN